MTIQESNQEPKRERQSIDILAERIASSVLSGDEQPDVVYDYLKASLKGSLDEEFRAMFLNSRSHLLAVETIQTGTVNKSVIYPRKIVERALCNHATGVIIAHNHPGGSISPSEDDCRVTRAIKDALKTVDIALLDHILIGGDSYFSFRENSLI